MSVYRTEIASSDLHSDNPIHQRLLFAYKSAEQYVSGDMLEIGCGEGRGVDTLVPLCKSYTAIDKNKEVIEELSKKNDSCTFIAANIPPMTMIESESFDTIVSFQVIEHIKNDALMVEEIFRMLKPEGKLILTTPNIKMSLTRNPWHLREYTYQGLKELLQTKFENVSMKGIFGNETIMNYYERNRRSVNKIMKYDFLNLQYNLPRALLQLPYEWLNQMNRGKLMKKNDDLVNNITIDDYYVNEYDDLCLDLFCIAQK